MSDVQFEIAIRASQGARRSQEDTALVWPSAAASTDAVSLIPLLAPVPGQAVAVLCDGMGGHAGGATASRTACEAFLPVVAAGTSPVRQRLYEALEDANAAIAQRVAGNAVYRGMGSTLVAVHLGPEGLSWVSVGDSLLYLWRRGEILLLNADHSLAPEIDKLAETGKISWAAARADPRRHYLRSALTGDDIEMIDLSERAAPLLDGDIVLLASDGIHTLEADRIARIISDCAAEPVAVVARALIAKVDAADAPHQDNTTVVAIRVRATEAVSAHV